MSRLIWLSDTHFDTVDEERRHAFFQELREIECEAILVGGDIADGPHSFNYLKRLQEAVQRPVYFILGNHDFYGLSIDIQKKRATEYAKAHDGLYYLTSLSFVALTATTGLVGHDGWADAGEGNFIASRVCLRDYFEIVELKGRAPQELQEKLVELGLIAAHEAEKKMEAALKEHEIVIFLTHAPPFREVCLSEGKIADDDWAPHYVASAMGQMLRRVMERHPMKQCLVLSGHTHHEAEKKILNNLTVRVAPATYGDLYYQFLTE